MKKKPFICRGRTQTRSMSKEMQLIEDMEGEDHVAEVIMVMTEDEVTKQNIQCYYCKRFGHVKAECWKLAKQNRPVQQDEKTNVPYFTYCKKIWACVTTVKNMGMCRINVGTKIGKKIM